MRRQDSMNLITDSPEVCGSRRPSTPVGSASADIMYGEIEDGKSSVLVSDSEEVEGEGEEGEEGEEEEDEGEEEEEDEEEGGERVAGEEDDDMEEEDSGAGFQDEMINPLDFVKDDASGAQLYEQFERIEYEALAQRKRKQDNHNGEGSAKKLRQDETAEATFEEIMEAMNYGSRKRRRRRKQKKKGRRKGGTNKLSPEVTKKLGEATLHFAHGRYEEAISVLNEVVRLAPVLCDPYHTLGLVYRKMGNEKKAISCYMIAAFLSPKNTSLWKLLVDLSIKQGNNGQAWYCLSKAIKADPEDITLKYHRASLLVEAKDYKNAADTYYKIVGLCPDDVEALKNAIKFYTEAHQPERCVSILEDYIKNHPPDSNPNMINSVASLCIGNNDYEKALTYIEHAKKLHSFGEEVQLALTVKEGICHAHLGNLHKAEDCFNLLLEEHNSSQISLITSVADCFLDLELYDSALKYYLKLEGKVSDKVFVHLKVAQCYLALKNTLPAIQVLYKAVEADENNIDSRLTLASLLIDQERDHEVVLLLSAPKVVGPCVETHGDVPKPWWDNWRIKLKLSHFYRERGMLVDFVKIVFPLVRESLSCIHKKVNHKKIPKRKLSERAEVLDEKGQADSVFRNFRVPLSKNDRLKATRAKRALENEATLKEKKKLAALTAGQEWESDDSDEEALQSPKEPPLPALIEDEKQFCLIKDLCCALTSLGSYTDALKILKGTLKLSHRILPTKKKEELRCLGAKMAFEVKDPHHAFNYVRSTVSHNPHNISAWNCYYKLVSRLEKRHSKHGKFLLRKRLEREVPPMIITGNQFTRISQHQAAAREYLVAYKLMPESPLVNLCAGTSLINLALGFRLQNKHQCVAQGLAFLYHNLLLCGDDNQEALYNIGRAYQHVGLVTLAASYYEKVLAIREKSYPFPEVVEEDQKMVQNSRRVNCDLRREAAFNLHLIYKTSGAIDLARQVLKDHCTL